jgi:hypothetical protein
MVALVVGLFGDLQDLLWTEVHTKLATLTAFGDNKNLTARNGQALKV